MSPNFDYVSISELQRITGKDRGTISKRVSLLESKPGDRGAKLYIREEALDAILASSAVVGEVVAKERRALADAERAEITVKKLKGELVSVDEMRTTVAEIVKTLYARTVRVLPSVLAPSFVGKTATEIEALLREGLSEVYNELKTLPENFLLSEIEAEPEADDENPE